MGMIGGGSGGWVYQQFVRPKNGWIPMNPETDEGYVPTWTPPQSPLPPKGK